MLSGTLATADAPTRRPISMISPAAPGTWLRPFSVVVPTFFAVPRKNDSSGALLSGRFSAGGCSETISPVFAEPPFDGGGTIGRLEMMSSSAIDAPDPHTAVRLDTFETQLCRLGDARQAPRLGL